MKPIKTDGEIRVDLKKILNKAIDQNNIDAGFAFIISNEQGKRPLEILQALYEYVTGIAIQPKMEYTWQPLDAYQLSKSLNRGDLVRCKGDAHAFMIDGLYNSFAVAVNTIDVSNLHEWQIKTHPVHGHFEDFKIPEKLVEVGSTIRNKGTQFEYVVTHVTRHINEPVHIAATRTEELNKSNIGQWEVRRGHDPGGAPGRTMKIAAIFKGTNSLGYVHNSLYDLRLTSHVSDSVIGIVREDGTGACAYGSIVAFLENWDLVRGK